MVEGDETRRLSLPEGGKKTRRKGKRDKEAGMWEGGWT